MDSKTKRQQANRLADHRFVFAIDCGRVGETPALDSSYILIKITASLSLSLADNCFQKVDTEEHCMENKSVRL